MRDPILDSADEVRDNYAAPMVGTQAGDTQPQNHVYEYLSLTIPRIIYDNPRFACKPRFGDDVLYAIGQALQNDLNRWAVDASIRTPLQRIAYDAMFSFGVGVTTLEPNPGVNPADIFGEYWPRLQRLSPRRYVMDSLCLWYGEARWQGHLWRRDRDDLLEEAKDKKSGWNAKLIKDLATADAADEAIAYGNSDSTVDRNQIVGYSIWVPEKYAGDDVKGYDPDIHHGVIYTIAGDSHYQGEGKPDKSEWIRDPMPYYGPRWGPYSVAGVYTVPDCPYPMSPLVALRGKMAEINTYRETSQRSIENYKRVVLVNAGNTELVQAIKSAQDSYVIPVPGLTGQETINLDLGGLTPQQVSVLELLGNEWDRASGITDAMRGNTASASTATAESIAEQASTARMAYLRQQFNDAVRQIGRTAAWLMWNETKGTEELSFDDLELDIDPYSMPYMTDQMRQSKALELLGLVGQIAPSIPQVPWVEWSDLLDDIGAAINQPRLGRYINVDAAKQQMAQMQQAAQMQQSMQGMAQRAGKKSSNALPGVQSGNKVRQSYAGSGR